jgi:WD40 repeat protein
MSYPVYAQPYTYYLAPPAPSPPPRAIIPPPQPARVTIQPPLSFWSTNAPKDPTPEQAYIPISTMLNEMRCLPDGDLKLSKVIQDFDSGCQQLLSKFSAVKAEKIEPMLRFIRFPFPKEASGDFSFDLVTDSTSISELVEFPGRVGPFPHPLYGEDPAKVSSDRFLTNEIWQSRAYHDQTIANFECSCLSDDHAGFVAPAAGSQRGVTVWSYRRPQSEFMTFNFECPRPVDAMALTGSSAWLLSKGSLSLVPFCRWDAPRTMTLGTTGAGTICPFLDGVAVGTTPAGPGPSLFYSSAKAPGEIKTLTHFYKGITCLAGIATRLVCGITGGSLLRLLSLEGREERVFVGHCGPVTRLQRLSDATFASAGQDDTVRIWDVRDRNPLSTILLPHISVTALTGSEDLVVCGFQSRCVGIVDLKKNVPLIGVQTQDFVPKSVAFDQSSGALYVFAVRESEQRLIFTDNERQNRQTVLRKYSGFLSAAGRSFIF